MVVATSIPDPRFFPIFFTIAETLFSLKLTAKVTVRNSGRHTQYTTTANTSRHERNKSSGRSGNVFDYEHKAAADEMRTSWETLVQDACRIYGLDISNELRKETTVVISDPVHTAAVITRHAAREQMIRIERANLQRA
jgi:hypothetical protein